MIDRGDYFTINRARQYGKTTILKALNRYLEKDYQILRLDFQKLSCKDFENEDTFVKALSAEILKKNNIPLWVSEEMQRFSDFSCVDVRLADLFSLFSKWCVRSEKPVVLMIDEVDSAANSQVFLDFLAQLRGYYIDREEAATFQSVILASVYDIKNLKSKFVTGENHIMNSPWNIAADFLVDMSFFPRDIAGMLAEYERDYHTGMNTEEISDFIYSYTSGYPYLVSRICKLIDERIAGSPQYPDKSSAWTKAGILDAIRILLIEKNTLFDSLINKLNTYVELKDIIYAILFRGEKITFNPDTYVISLASMFGFVKNADGFLAIANRVFETRIYNFFLSEEEIRQRFVSAEQADRNQFIQNGRLNMELVLEKFVSYWGELSDSSDGKFIEDNERKLFLLFLNPIINGTGNYYIEAQTRDNRKTDVIVDYQGEQFIIELKIWRGNAYKERGEKQLLDYLEYYHLRKGYMLSFNFNQKKSTGVQKIFLGDKVLVEAVV